MIAKFVERAVFSCWTNPANLNIIRGTPFKEGIGMKKWLAVFAIAVMLVAMPSQSEAQVSVRLGLSSMTGLAGIEYQTGNISLGAGPLAGPIAVSARYALNTEGNSLWAGLAFVLNAAEVTEADWSDKDVPSVGPLLGYRIEFNEKWDFSIGGGYGVWLGVDKDVEVLGVKNDTGGPLIDFSFGYSF
jgi:hypothetical protein